LNSISINHENNAVYRTTSNKLPQDGSIKLNE